MASVNEKKYAIDRARLKLKYRSAGPQLIQKYCNEIDAKNRSATIQVEWLPEVVIFHVRGQHGGILNAIQYIQGEFLPRELMRNVPQQDATEQGLLLPRIDAVGISGPRKASEYMSVDQQNKLKVFDLDNPILLTVDALRQHDLLNTPTELRQFACRDCDLVWWRVVPSIKMVSTCKKCYRKFAALDRFKEYGVGRFICPNCKHVFYSRCHADTKCPCYECQLPVSKPYIHQDNKLHSAPNKGGRKHWCDECKGRGNCPNYKQVVFASRRHISTGSSVATWLSQPEFVDPAPYFEFTGGRPDGDQPRGQQLSPIVSEDENPSSSS